MTTLQRPLAELAAHLRATREETLRAWRKAVMEDRTLTTAHSLPRRQLDDHIPGLLEAYLLRLSPAMAAPGAGGAKLDEQAVAHGLHRWQQGYDLQEVSRELGRLNEAVVVQLDAYARARPELDPEVMSTARRIWAETSGVELSRSIAEYFRLRQVEAAGHVQDLEQALERIRELEKERADLWHQAVHDMRGNLGVVKTATAGLSQIGADQPRQEKFLRILDRNVALLHHLLDDVMDLARLQAGREVRRVSDLDVAALLSALVDDLQGDAAQRSLFLRKEGPTPFVVAGDAVKVRRLVQNLVLNALKYTKQGGVSVTWGNGVATDTERWMISIQDTGPGFAAGPGSPLVGALEQATEAAGHTTVEESNSGVTADRPPLAALAGRKALRPEQGEGIGLSIVKRLAEMLDATVEVESDATGTTFRILLPRHYAS